MIVTTLAPPAAEPLTLSDARAYLGIGYDGEDALVEGLIKAARARIEEQSGVAMISRSLRVVIDQWGRDIRVERRLRLPVRPAVSLTSVKVTAASGEREDVTDRFHLEAGRAAAVVWESGALPKPGAPAGGIEIEYIAGFGEAPDDVAEGLKLAVLRLAAHAYHKRAEAMDGELPKDVAGLIAPWRRVRL
jgi:uncharacterized phiE125 gp8 family phage protein